MFKHLVVLGLVVSILPAPGDAPARAQSPSSQSTPAEDPETSEEREEVESERSKYAKVYREPDGSYTAEVSPEQIHFKRDGSWHEIDTTLVPCEADCAYRVRRGPLDIEFAGSGSAARLVEMASGKHELAFGLSGAGRAGYPRASSLLRVVGGRACRSPALYSGSTQGGRYGNGHRIIRCPRN
jgi:hypothetical protein